MVPISLSGRMIPVSRIEKRTKKVFRDLDSFVYDPFLVGPYVVAVHAVAAAVAVVAPVVSAVAPVVVVVNHVVFIIVAPHAHVNDDTFVVVFYTNL